MSEPTASSANNPTDPSPAASTAGEKTPKQKDPRRWRRRAKWAVVILILLVIATRLILVVAFPTVLRKVAARYGFDVSYERTEFYLIDSDMGIWHLRFTPKTGGDPFLTAEYCRADISSLNLLRGRLAVRRVEADGVDINITRDEHGNIPVLQNFIQSAPATAATTQKTAEASKAQSLSLDPPLTIDALRLSRVRTHLRDRSVKPPIDAMLETTIRLSDVGSSIRPTRFLMDLASTPFLDAMRIEGQGTAHGQTLEANIDLSIRGLHPKTAAGYLLPLGAKGVANEVNMFAKASIQLAPTTAPAQQNTNKPIDLKGDALISDVKIEADGVESAGVDRIALDVPSFNQNAVHVAEFVIDGVHARAARTPTGLLRFAGMELVPTQSAAATQPAPAAAQQSFVLPKKWVVDLLALRHLDVAFTDESVTPPAQLALTSDDIHAKALVADPAHPDKPVEIAGKLTSPGMAKSITLSGSATPFAPKKAVHVDLLIEGIKPDAIRGYLDAAGLESQFQNGTLACDLDASGNVGKDGAISAAAHFGHIKLTDGKDLFAFDGVSIDGVSIDPAVSHIRADSVVIAGPKMNVVRDPQGTLIALGFKTKPPVRQPARTAVVTPAANRAAAPVVAPVAATTNHAAAVPTATAIAPPVLEIGKLAWKGIDIHFDDQAVAPANSFVLNDAGVELSDLHLDLGGKSPNAAPGKVRAWLALPGIAGKLTVDGTVAPRSDGTTADLAIAGRQLDARRLAEYVKPLGIEPTLKNGSLQLHVQTAIGATSAGLHAKLAVTDFHYADGSQKLVDLTKLNVDNVALQPTSVAVDSVNIDQPHLLVAREKNGAIDVAGIRIAAPATQPATASVASAPTSPPPPQSSSPTATPPAMVAMLTQLRINDASLQWQDAAVTPAVDTTAHASVALDNFVVGKDAPPAKLSVTARVDQTIDNATVAGTVLVTPTTQQATLALTADGVKVGALASYLPPSIQSSLKDGRFKLNLDAGAAVNPAGGQAVHLVAGDLDFRDGADAPKPLFHLDSARIIAPRIDIPGNVLAIDEVSVAGIETELHRRADGSMNILGLNIRPAGAAPAASQPAADATLAPSQPATPAQAAPTTAPALDVNQILASRKAKAPLITLDKLDIAIKRIAVVDDAQSGAQPIALSDVHLHNRNRIEMLGDDALSRPPAEIELTGAVDPLVQHFAVETKVAPFASPATLDMTINVDGIHGQGITQAMPELEKTLDGKPLSDGKFQAHLEAQAKIARRGPAAYDLAEPFEIAFVLHDVALRNADNPKILAGVQEVRADAVRVSPNTGDVIVHSLEINTPIAFVDRDAAGIHAAGLIIKLPPPATQPAAGKSPAAPPPPSTPAVPVAPAQKPSSEIRIDKLLMSGLNFRFEDHTSDPPLIVPLTGLEVEARDLSTLAPYEDRPVRFNVLVNAGKVPLEGAKPQELFSEIAANGKIGLYPKPNGYAKTSVSGFELLGLYGPAKANKVTIGGGVFDSTVDLRFENNGDLDTRSRFLFTDLKLSEPPDGPIRTFLKLPSPVDTVILVLQDADGTITAPLHVAVKDGQVSGSQIASQAVSAFGSIVATAIASSGLKVANGVTGGVSNVLGATPIGGLTNMIGLTREKTPAIKSADVVFAPGVAEAPANSADLNAIVDQLRKNSKLKVVLRHELGKADVERAAQRANPSRAEASALAAQLRDRKDRLLELRRAIAPQAQAMLTANSGSAAPATVERLRAIDRDLAANENALDSVYDLLRPGADRQADRRTRAAAIAIGAARLSAVRDALLASNIPGIKDRIQETHAQFNPAETDAPGHVTVLLQEVK